jgi:hypothetical protein
MSIFRRITRFAFLPAIRAAQQMRESSERLGRMRQQQREQVRQHLEQLRLQAAASGEDNSPAARFETLCEQRNWTPQALQAQLVAVRRTKVAALVGSVLGTIAGLILLMIAPLWALLIFVPAVAGLTALGLVSALKFGLFQAQLERRELIGLGDYLSRQDLFSHLLGTRPKTARLKPPPQPGRR